MKYKVSVNYLEYYEEKEIEAEDEQEAEEKYLEMINDGSIIPMGGDYDTCIVRRIGHGKPQCVIED